MKINDQPKFALHLAFLTWWIDDQQKPTCISPSGLMCTWSRMAPHFVGLSWSLGALGTKNFLHQQLMSFDSCVVPTLKWPCVKPWEVQINIYSLRLHLTGFLRANWRSCLDVINLNHLVSVVCPSTRQSLVCKAEFITWRLGAPLWEILKRSSIFLNSQVWVSICAYLPTIKRPCVKYRLDGKSVKYY